MNTDIYKKGELQQIVSKTIDLIRENGLDVDDVDTIGFIVQELIKLNGRGLLLD